VAAARRIRWEATAVIVLGLGGPWSSTPRSMRPSYSHAVRVDISYLLRAGSVLCVVFLAMRMRHGPRERVPPWHR
jgi:hypothetical protein